MAQTDQFRALNDRLVTRRAALLRAYPFFGRLLLRLRFGFAACGTAYTDMRHIVFVLKQVYGIQRRSLHICRNS